MNREKERNSSYELMRIVSMFLIVLYHIILHGKVLENCQNEGLKLFLNLLNSLLWYTLILLFLLQDIIKLKVILNKVKFGVY